MSARDSCESYCSRDMKCQGCALECDINCFWIAYRICRRHEEWPVKPDKDISLKPGKCDDNCCSYDNTLLSSNNNQLSLIFFKYHSYSLYGRSCPYSKDRRFQRPV